MLKYHVCVFGGVQSRNTDLKAKAVTLLEGHNEKEVGTLISSIYEEFISRSCGLTYYLTGFALFFHADVSSFSREDSSLCNSRLPNAEVVAITVFLFQ